jgi:catechol 2,3-dioxygenase-like lactoylglutathione lyase family enzyme
MRGLLSLFRGMLLFGAGVVVGTCVMQSTAAQEPPVRTGLRLNHVGIAVKDMQESLNFYTKVMGFRVAFGGTTPDGKPGTTYLQISRDTFLEVAPASANLPEGITHIGIQADDEDATVKRLRVGGATVTDPRISPALSKSKLANVTDPNGIRLELNELIPGSETRRAVDSWKE